MCGPGTKAAFTDVIHCAGYDYDLVGVIELMGFLGLCSILLSCSSIPMPGPYCFNFLRSDRTFYFYLFIFYFLKNC